MSLTSIRSPGRQPQALPGQWPGTSTCIRATWNAAACNDEVIAYDFVPLGADSIRSLLHAGKLVGRKFEPRCDLEFTYSPASETWDGESANARVHIRLTYELRADTLYGKVTRLPSLQVGWYVVATRPPT